MTTSFVHKNMGPKKAHKTLWEFIWSPLFPYRGKLSWMDKSDIGSRLAIIRIPPHTPDKFVLTTLDFTDHDNYKREEIHTTYRNFPGRIKEENGNFFIHVPPNPQKPISDVEGDYLLILPKQTNNMNSSHTKNICGALTASGRPCRNSKNCMYH